MLADGILHTLIMTLLCVVFSELVHVKGVGRKTNFLKILYLLQSKSEILERF